MNGLVVERAGLLSTVQDSGRWGLQHLGVPVSGWMDDWSARLANRLAGNLDGEAVVEVTALGPTLRADGALTIAVAGAVFDVTIGGHRARTPLVGPLPDGATLEFGARQLGTRAYVAVRGGIALAPVLGSRATDIRSGLGGIEGRRLRTGDRLPVRTCATTVTEVRTLAPAVWMGAAADLRVLPMSAQTPAEHARFVRLCDARYRLASASDRTGYRLMADRPLPDADATLVSQPVATGTIQLPPGGSPLLLMADRQTTGGYATIAVVTSADLPLAGQLGPGDACAFVPSDWTEACRALDEREQALDRAAARRR